ncbi:MAG: hypothetical protein EZS28_041772 [Streblomastix strix]|uniref:Uncharacterized protein n=1 Tax=Streblomastix strix TaxID=222440 RepID=A0A5J4TXB3_9EUKA|nr:MAG: hypothetical protein EZS28_041772 [Streblomastix strix]
MTQLKQSLPPLIQEYPNKNLLKGSIIVKQRSKARETAMNHQKIPQHMIRDHMARMTQESAVNILQNMARGHPELEVNPNNQIIDIRDLKDIQQEQDLDGSGIHKTDQGSELRQPSQLVEGSSKMRNGSNGINGSQQGQSKQFKDKQIGELKQLRSFGNLDIARYCAIQSVPQQSRQFSNLNVYLKSRIKSRLSISNQLPLQQREFAVGGRLVHFLEEWKKIKADVLIEKGIKAY